MYFVVVLLIVIDFRKAGDSVRCIFIYAFELTLQIAEKKKDYGFLDREIHLQEIDPEMFLTFGSEVWR